MKYDVSVYDLDDNLVYVKYSVSNLKVEENHETGEIIIRIRTDEWAPINLNLNKETPTKKDTDENKCPDCGTTAIFSEGCLTCTNCGWSKCS